MRTLTALLVLLPSLLAAAAAQAIPAPASLAAGTAIKAEVVVGFDSADSQVGDLASVTTLAAVKQGGLDLPKGSTLDGQVVAVAPAADNDSKASIAVLFHSAVTPQGAQVPIHAVIVSLELKAAKPSIFDRLGRGGLGRRGGGERGGRRSDSGGSSHPEQIAVRVPANAATAGSVLSNQEGNFWIFPKTKLTLRVVAAAKRSSSPGR
ncbi:MAG TPA: hypothetical protein VMV31_11200 [Terriglobales bacterium]|nr:hypothetical protein [Terriglobales bacterium]